MVAHLLGGWRPGMVPCSRTGRPASACAQGERDAAPHAIALGRQCTRQSVPPVRGARQQRLHAAPTCWAAAAHRSRAHSVSTRRSEDEGPVLPLNLACGEWTHFGLTFEPTESGPADDGAVRAVPAVITLYVNGSVLAAFSADNVSAPPNHGGQRGVRLTRALGRASGRRSPRTGVPSRWGVTAATLRGRAWWRAWRCGRG